MKRIFSLLIAAVMLIGTFPVVISGNGSEVDISGGSGSGENALYEVVAEGGAITLKSGNTEGGKYDGGSIVTVSFDATEFDGLTFDHWTSASGEKISAEEFSLLVDQDAYFFPVFSDAEPDFGEWELYKAGGSCEIPDVWKREDPVTGLVEFAYVLYNGGYHTQDIFEYVDEDHCKAVCSHCGYEEIMDHYWSAETTLRPATHTVSGIVGKRCYYCGATVETDIGTTDEHTWGGWTVVTESVNGQPGVRRRTCEECGESQDCWYIDADWEKYYGVNSRIVFTADYNNQWGDKTEGHYHFINNDGKDTYVYGCSWADKNGERVVQFMWIDEADELGRKPIYHAKRMENGWGYHWALIGYTDTFEGYISYIDGLYGDQSNVSHASALFDMFRKYEELYNDACLPADGSPDYFASQSYWSYTGDSTISRGLTYNDELAIPVRVYTNTNSQTMYIDPETGACLYYSDYSPRMSYHIDRMNDLVTDEDFDALSAEDQAEVTRYSDLATRIMYDTQNTTHSIKENYFDKPDPKNFRVIIFSNINAGPIPDHFTTTVAFDNNYPGTYIEMYHATSDLAGGGYYTHGYDIHDFGIVKTIQPGSTSPELGHWYSNTNYAVDLKQPEVDGWAFDHWEIYNWQTGEWELFTETNSSGEPCLNYTEVNGDKTEFTIDRRLTDVTILKAVYNEVHPETVHVKVTGGTMLRLVGSSRNYLGSEEDVPVDSYICPVNDYDAAPAGKTFDHWRVFVDGVETVPAYEYMYGCDWMTVTADTEFVPVYVDEEYDLYAYAMNGLVYMGTEEYWGGSYTAGTQITLTTTGDDGYTYFKGWYISGKGGKPDTGAPSSPEDTGDKLLSTDTEFTYTTEASYATIYAVWSDSGEPAYGYHDVTVVNGFGYQMSEILWADGLKLSAFRVPDYRDFMLVPDPTCTLELEKFEMTGTLNGDPYSVECTDMDYPVFNIGDSESCPHELLVTGIGTGHEHTMEEFPAAAATCTEAGNSLYYACAGCGKFYSDAAGTAQIEEDSWVIEALGHDWGDVEYEWSGDWSSVTASRVCRRDPSHTETEKVQTVITTIYANNEGTGLETYTATFENPAFPPVSRARTLAVVGTYVPGDVNDSDEMNMDDVLSMLRFIILPGLYNVDGYGGSLDFNGDHALNLYDVIRLLQYYLFPELYPIQ